MDVKRELYFFTIKINPNAPPVPFVLFGLCAGRIRALIYCSAFSSTSFLDSDETANDDEIAPNVWVRVLPGIQATPFSAPSTIGSGGRQYYIADET